MYNDKELAITIGFGTLDFSVKLSMMILQENMWTKISILSTMLFVGLLLILIIKYRNLATSYELIKFLFFGIDKRTFNYLPKLKIYMDFLKIKNEVDVDRVKFECLDDNQNNMTSIEWSIEGIYNKTNKSISTYSLYSTSSVGVTNWVDIELDEGAKNKRVNTDIVKNKNGIQVTSFSFPRDLSPKDNIKRISIKMQMKNAFDFTHKEIVPIYPRNYGRKVNNLDIVYRTKGIREMVVLLHEIRKIGKTYEDNEIRNAHVEICDIDGMIEYSFGLGYKEIHMNSMYYLLIKDKETHSSTF